MTTTTIQPARTPLPFRLCDKASTGVTRTVLYTHLQLLCGLSRYSDKRNASVPQSFPLSLPFHVLPFPSPSLQLPSLYPVRPLRSRPLKYSYEGLWERCKLPQRGLGRSPSGNRIWCILALKSDIWWHEIY